MHCFIYSILTFVVRQMRHERNERTGLCSYVQYADTAFWFLKKTIRAEAWNRHNMTQPQSFESGTLTTSVRPGRRKVISLSTVQYSVHCGQIISLLGPPSVKTCLGTEVFTLNLVTTHHTYLRLLCWCQGHECTNFSV